MKITSTSEDISSHRTGSIVDLTVEQVTAIVGFRPDTEPSGDGKVTVEWRFKVVNDGLDEEDIPCAIWDYKGSLNWNTLSVFMPPHIGKKLFGDNYKSQYEY